MRIFAGYDWREAVGWSVFERSLIERCSVPFALTPIRGQQRDGSNAFTYARFLVPYLCDFKGWAIFMDGSDMMLRADASELWAQRDPSKAVQVVKHDYRTSHHRKYIGTRMAADNADYPRKNWSSVVIWNCEHPANARISPALVESMTGSYLHRFSWLHDDEIGALPGEWNHLVREYAANPQAKLAHYTLGIPAFICYAKDEFAEEWLDYARGAQTGLQHSVTLQQPSMETA